MPKLKKKNVKNKIKDVPKVNRESMRNFEIENISIEYHPIEQLNLNSI